MIRRKEGDTVWVIHQAAHAFIAGQIAEHWIGERNMNLAPREELILAAYVHDAGWSQIERAPQTNGHGLPRTFTEMNLEEHFGIWETSIESVFAQNRYAGLLTCMHCTALYEQRLRYLDDPPTDQARIKFFLDKWHGWEQAQIATLTDHPRYSQAVQSRQLAENLRLLQVWDYLSLLVCMSTVPEQMLEDVPLANGERSVLHVAPGGPRTMQITPYPLDQPLTLWIDGRRVTGGPFETDAELQKALDGVPYMPLVFELRSF